MKPLVIDYMNKVVNRLKQNEEEAKKGYLIYKLTGEYGLYEAYEESKLKYEVNEYLRNRIEQIKFIHTETLPYMSNEGTFSDTLNFYYDDQFLKYTDNQKITSVISQIYYSITHSFKFDNTPGGLLQKLIEIGTIDIDFKYSSVKNTQIVYDIVKQIYNNQILITKNTSEGDKELTRILQDRHSKGHKIEVLEVYHVKHWGLNNELTKPKWLNRDIDHNKEFIEEICLDKKNNFDKLRIKTVKELIDTKVKIQTNIKSYKNSNLTQAYKDLELSFTQIMNIENIIRLIEGIDFTSNTKKIDKYLSTEKTFCDRKTFYYDKSVLEDPKSLEIVMCEIFNVMQLPRKNITQITLDKILSNTLLMMYSTGLIQEKLTYGVKTRDKLVGKVNLDNYKVFQTSPEALKYNYEELTKQDDRGKYIDYLYIKKFGFEVRQHIRQ